MVHIDTKVQSKKNILLHAPLTYNEVVAYLDTHWSPTTTLHTIAQLDESFGFPSKKLDIVTVSGTSGKTSTIYYTAKLLQEEGLVVGSFCTPHTLLYNERFVINNEQISHKTFTELANNVIQKAQDKNLTASSKDILTMMALLFFAENNVQVALLENAGTYNLDPVLYADVKIAAVTRIVPNNPQDDTPAAFANLMLPLSSKTHFVAADQHKQNLQIMQQMVQAKGSTWAMPTRKLAPLNYPFEQLHGRCAALAQKIAHIYHDHFLQKAETTHTQPSLLSKPKGLRGRPTLQAKKASEAYPAKSLELFWKNLQPALPYHFELLGDQKPMILLDNADNIDALQNLFLGFRLLAYKQSFKNVSLILGCHQGQFQDEDLLKELRFFNKKTSGMIAFCPIEPTMGEKSQPSFDAVKMATAAKNAKIKAKAFKNFQEAFSMLHNSSHDKNDLIIITGSQAIIRQYLEYQHQAAAAK